MKQYMYHNVHRITGNFAAICDQKYSLWRSTVTSSPHAEYNSMRRELPRHLTTPGARYLWSGVLIRVAVVDEIWLDIERQCRRGCGVLGKQLTPVFAALHLPNLLLAELDE